MRVLVTGGAGYVGSVSVERLLGAGHDVVVLDDLSTGHREAVPDTATLDVGSYGDAEGLSRLLESANVDAILRCAAPSLVGESVRHPAPTYPEVIADVYADCTDMLNNIQWLVGVTVMKNLNDTQKTIPIPSVLIHLCEPR